ncbi:MAG: DUF1772 domain-containing protein [Candidatus Binatia bacterium]
MRPRRGPPRRFAAARGDAMLTTLAALCAGLFAGAAGYISLVEHWARSEAGPAVALAQFRPRLPRARHPGVARQRRRSPCAAAWLAGAGLAWLVVALLLFAIVGFTLVRITPVYTRLLDPSLTADSPDAPALLAQWGRLHHVRSVLGLLAFVVALAAS